MVSFLCYTYTFFCFLSRILLAVFILCSPQLSHDGSCRERVTRSTNGSVFIVHGLCLASKCVHVLVTSQLLKRAHSIPTFSRRSLGSSKESDMRSSRDSSWPARFRVQHRLRWLSSLNLRHEAIGAAIIIRGTRCEAPVVGDCRSRFGACSITTSADQMPKC